MMDETIVSKYDENNLKPVVSVRQLFLIVDGIMEDLQNVCEEYGDHSADVGYIVGNIQDLIQRHFLDILESLREQ